MITIIIPMRAGSKGVPNKNIRIVRDKPLYEYTLEQAEAFKADRILISTDIPSLLGAFVEREVDVIHRPFHLCGDEVKMEMVIDDLIKTEKIKGTVVLLQVTSPLRRCEHITDAVDKYKSGAFDLVMSVAEANRSILKFGLISDSGYHPISNAEYVFSNRQELPNVYRPNGAVYVFDADNFIKIGHFPNKNIGCIVMSEADSLDIDSENDFNVFENLLIHGGRNEDRS